MMDEKSRFAGSRRLLLVLGVFELQVDARAVLPQPFETVVFAGFLVHDVDDEITVVEQHPLAFGQAFAGARLAFAGLEVQVLLDFLGDGEHLAFVRALAMSIASVMANGSVTSNATMSVAFMRSAAAAAMRMASMESCNAGMFSAPIRASSLYYVLRVFGIDHGVGRDVVADHGAGSGGDAVADGDGGDEQVARADMHIRSDGGVVLVHAVIVGGDGAAADVGVLAQVASPT